MPPEYKFSCFIDLQKGGSQMSFVVSALTSLAGLFANVGSVACAFWFIDEPECPKSLIK